MAFNVGKFNFDLPKPPRVSTDFGQAPRKLDLTAEEAKRVDKIMQYLSKTGLEIDSLFELFNDWQSSKTKSIKRFVLSLSFILTLTIFAGVDITKIHLFNVTVAKGMSTIFLIALAFILISSFLYFRYLENKDWEVHTAKIAFVSNNLERCLELAEEIDDILERNKIESVEVLFNDFKSSFDRFNDDLKAYAAINFYKNELKDTHKSFDLIQKLELGGIYFLGIMSLIAIISSYLR